MGTLTKKLHILKTGGTEETCNIYTTAEEVGGSPYLALEVDGAKGYVKLGSTTDANATHLRVEKDGVIYAAWKEAVTYVNVTITQSANQTIHVYTPKKSGGTDHTSSFTIPKGTSYEAEVIPADGYTAGTLNVNAGGGSIAILHLVLVEQSRKKKPLSSQQNSMKTMVRAPQRSTTTFLVVSGLRLTLITVISKLGV